MTKKSYSLDSVYVKFIRQKIDITEYGYCSKYTIKDKLYLFVKEENDTIIKCFIIKKNELIALGKLQLHNKSQMKIAVREGYWRIKNGQKFEKNYFVDDKLFKEDSLPLGKPKKVTTQPDLIKN